MDEGIRYPRFVKGKPLLDQVTAERLNAIEDAIRARTPREGVGLTLDWTSGGFSYTAKPGRKGGGGGLALPLTVSVSEVDSEPIFEVSPGVAYFENEEYTPTIDGQPISNDPAPQGSFVGGDQIILNWTGTLQTQQNLFYEDDQTSYLVTHFGPSARATVFNGVTVEAKANPAAEDKRPTPDDPTFDQFGTLAFTYQQGDALGADQANWGSCWITAQTFVTRIDYNGTEFYESASVGVTSWGAIEV